MGSVQNRWRMVCINICVFFSLLEKFNLSGFRLDLLWGFWFHKYPRVFHDKCSFLHHNSITLLFLHYAVCILGAVYELWYVNEVMWLQHRTLLQILSLNINLNSLELNTSLMFTKHWVFHSENSQTFQIYATLCHMTSFTCIYIFQVLFSLISEINTDACCISILILV